MPIDKDDGAQGLILRRRADAAIHGKMVEEALNLWVSHRSGMFFVIEENELPYPVKITFFGSETVVAGSDFSAYRFKKG